MKPILIVKNSHEGPGLLAVILDERKIPSSIVALKDGEKFPVPDEFGAVVVLGGPDSANDTDEKMLNELERIREILAKKIPYLGICLGLQTLVKAAGGRVVKSPVKELGFRGPDASHFRVQLTQEGRADPLFKDIEDSSHVFQLHGEMVEFDQDGDPSDADSAQGGDAGARTIITLLGTGNFCKNQAVKVGDNAYGLQCHFELTPAMFESWIAEDADLKKLDASSLRADFEAVRDQYAATGRRLFENFLEIAGY